MKYRSNNYESAHASAENAHFFRDTLTFEDRVAYQRAIEEIYWQRTSTVAGVTQPDIAVVALGNFPLLAGVTAV